MEIANYTKVRKAMLIAGIVIGVVDLSVIYPVEYYIFRRNRVIPVEKRKRMLRYLLQATLYFVLLLVVSLLFFYGRDWM